MLRITPRGKKVGCLAKSPRRAVVFGCGGAPEADGCAGLSTSEASDERMIDNHRSLVNKNHPGF